MAPTLKTLASFVSGEGVGPAAPSFGVILNPVTGDLYGTSDAGGVNSAGALFRVALIDGAYSTSPTVVLSDGGDQSIGLDYLVADAAGNVYDANSDGGPANAGILIKIAPDGTASTLPTSGGISGYFGAGYAIDPAGNPVGVGRSGGEATLFEIDSHSGAETAFTSATSSNDDILAGTTGPLLVTPDGNLFGTNGFDTAYSNGAVYEVAYANGAYSATAKVVVAFDGADGLAPLNGVVADAQGDLFGTAATNSETVGEVFEISKLNGVYSSTPTVLANIVYGPGYADAGPSIGGLIIDKAGDLFGFAANGDGGLGYVFEIADNKGVYDSAPRILVTFDGDNGSFPVGSLVADAAGNLFGATYSGGAGSGGTVFEITDSGYVAGTKTTYSVADALAVALSNPPSPVTAGVVLDTAGNVETLTPDQIAALAADGFVKLSASDGELDLSLADALAVSRAATITVASPAGSPTAVSDNAANEETLTPDQFGALHKDGFTEIKASDAPLKVSAAQAISAVDDNIELYASAGVGLDDTDANIDALTPQQLLSVAKDGVTEIEATASALTLTVAQALAAIDNGVGATLDDNGLPIEISDTAAAIEALTSDELLALQKANFSLLAVNDGSFSTDVAHATAIANANLKVSVEGEYGPQISDTTANLSTLSVDGISAAAGAGFDYIKATDGNLEFSLAQAKAVTQSKIHVAVSKSESYTFVFDAAAGLEALAIDQIAAFAAAGFDYLASNDGGFSLSVAQAAALSSGGMGETVSVLATPGEKVQIYDTATAIKGLNPDQIKELGVAGFEEFSFTDGNLVLNVDQALAIHEAGIQLDAAVDLYAQVLDSSGNIEALTPDEIKGLGASGFVGLESNLGDLQFDVEQALAVLAAEPLLLVAQGEVEVRVQDTAANLEALTPEQIAALDKVHVTDFVATDGDLKFSVAQALVVANSETLHVRGPTDAFAIVFDTAENLATLTVAEIASLGKSDFTTLESTDGDLKLNTEQALAVDADGVMTVAALDGYSAIVYDSAAYIQGLTADQITALSKDRFDRLESNDGDLKFNLADATAIFADGDVSLAAPEGSEVQVEDTSANLAAIDPGAIAKLAQAGFTEITSTDVSLEFDVAQALAVDADKQLIVSAPEGKFAVVKDTAANLEALSAAEITGLVKDGFSGLVSTDAGLDFTVEQANALSEGITAIAPEGQKVRIVDDASNLGTLTETQIADLDTTGINAIVSTDGSVLLSVEQVQALAATKNLTVQAPTDDYFYALDYASALETLTPDEIDALTKIGVHAYQARSGQLQLSVDQALAMADDGNGLVVSFTHEPITIYDEAIAFNDLTATDIENLGLSGFTELFSSSGDLKLSVEQALAVVADGNMKVFVTEGDFTTVIDGASALQALTPDEITKLQAVGFFRITSDDVGLNFTVDQADALMSGDGLDVTAPADVEIAVVGDAGAIEQLTADKIAKFAEFGFTRITSDAGDLTLTVAQAQAVANAKTLTLAVPDGAGTVVVSDAQAALASLTSDQIAALGKAGVGELATNSGDLDLTVAQALAVDNAGMKVSAPSGAVAAIVDSPDAFGSLTADKIASLAKDGFGALSTNAGDLHLSVAQSLAAEAAGMRPTAPNGGQALIYDVNSAIDLLAPGQFAALAAFGFTGISSSAGTLNLTVAQVQAIEGAGLSIASNSAPAVAIVDTAANIAADFDAINADSHVGAILMTDTGTPVLSLTNAQAAKDTKALSEIQNVKYVVEAPAISGTVAGQATTSEAPVKPFSGVTITDANPGATDTLTITLGGAGGVLSGAGLSGGTGGVYTLSGTASAVTSALHALSFTPTAGAGGTTSTTTFALSDASSAFGPASIDTTTSVVDTDPVVQVAQDGYILGGTVSYANGSNGGATATTDARGKFTLTGGTGPLVLTGGVDTSTGLAFTGALEAPNGSTVLSPLTSLIVAVATATGGTTAAANAAVLTALGLPSGTDLTTLDSEAGTLTGNSTATQVFEAQANLQNLLSLVQSLGGAAGAKNALNAVASWFASAGSAVSQATIISTATTAAGLDPSQSGAISSILTSTNSALASQLSGVADPKKVYGAVSGAELALQGAAVSSLAAASGDAGASAAASTFVQNLPATLASADAGVATPRAPTITGPANGSTTSNSQPAIVGTGAAGDTVTVSIDGSIAGTAQVAADGAWTFDPGGALGNGNHNVTATQANIAGTVSAVSTTDMFTVSATGMGTGDVHMVTFDGLHYDFQANGTYTLARSTLRGDAFQVQIQTAAIWAAHAVSLTTAVAAQLGGDTITFDAGASNPISVDGAADTTLSAADPVQTFAGGKLVEVNANTFRIDWNSGQALTVSDEGSYLDTGVSLGAANGPGSVQGLLGSDTGQANDFQLADGTVLRQPSAQDILGAFATSWRVDAAQSLFSKDTTPAPEIDLAGGESIALGGVATNAVKFDDASASVLTLLTPQDFAGTIAGLAGDGAIDLAGFGGATAISSILGTGAAGTTTDVTLTDGGQAATLKLLNGYAGEFSTSVGAYALASDGGATQGTMLRLVAHG